MAKIGDLDSIVNNLVGRGLVSPKMVGRSVGQALIEELKNLPSNLAQSSAIRSNTQSRRLSTFQNQIAPTAPVVSSGGRGRSLSSGVPIPVAKSLGGLGSKDFITSVISDPATGKPALRSFQADSPIVQELGLDKPNLPLTTGVRFGSIPFANLEALISDLLQTSVNPRQQLQITNSL